MLKKAECQRIDRVLEKTLESPLDCKEIQPVHPKGNQSWTLIGRTDAEAEASVLWPPDVKYWLIRKDPGAGKGWRQQKVIAEAEMVGWHHRHEFEQAVGVGWWWTGKPGMLQYMGSQRVGHDWVTELNWGWRSSFLTGHLLENPFTSLLSGCLHREILKHANLLLQSQNGRVS